MPQSTMQKNAAGVSMPDDFYFDGLCMSPGESWNAQMELEHWNRYETFEYLAESKKVLDIACGEGYGTALLARLASSATGIDLSERNITHAKAKYGALRDNLQYAVEDATNLPDGYGQFDIVYSFETIEHVGNIASFVTCLAKVMKDDGIAIISTPKPNIDPNTGRPFNPFHVREMSAVQLQSVLQEHFGYVELAGQSRQFPCQIHSGFEDSTDAYAIAIASNDEGKVESIIRRLPEIDTTMTREELFTRQFNRIRNFQKPMRILFVPLVERSCDNPSDRRRIALPAEFLRQFGAEVAIINKQDVLNIGPENK